MGKTLAVDGSLLSLIYLLDPGKVFAKGPW